MDTNPVDTLNAAIDTMQTTVSGLQADNERLRSQVNDAANAAADSVPFGVVAAAAAKVQAIIDSVTSSQAPAPA